MKFGVLLLHWHWYFSILKFSYYTNSSIILLNVVLFTLNNANSSLNFILFYFLLFSLFDSNSCVYSFCSYNWNHIYSVVLIFCFNWVITFILLFIDFKLNICNVDVFVIEFFSNFDNFVSIFGKIKLLS